MRGDAVEVAVDNGTGVPAVYRVRATRVGRRVELDIDGAVVTVREVRRDGTAVDTMHFAFDRIIAIREYCDVDAASPTASAADATPTAERSPAGNEDAEPAAARSPRPVAKPAEPVGRADRAPAGGKFTTRGGKTKKPKKRKR